MPTDITVIDAANFNNPLVVLASNVLAKIVKVAIISAINPAIAPREVITFPLSIPDIITSDKANIPIAVAIFSKAFAFNPLANPLSIFLTPSKTPLIDLTKSVPALTVSLNLLMRLIMPANIPSFK